MIKYITGNILDSNTEAIINPVNTVGVMGKGIALQFKKAYPNNYKSYVDACKNGEIEIGKLFVKKDSTTNSGEKTIINFPTKKDWRKPSEYKYIEAGLNNLKAVITEYKLKSVAIPPLGAGNGGLEWQKVKILIEDNLKNIDAEIIVFEPTAEIKEILKKERTKLTKGRALLLYVLYDLVKNGEYVSEFSSEKICYFLQRFGAEKFFKLNFEPRFYGPYSGKVRYVLNALNGSYITGYSDMNKKPFEPLSLISDGYEDIKTYVEKDLELKNIAIQTINFLDGYYSDFSLELLSSIDYLACKNKSYDYNLITYQLEHWSDRKKSMFFSNPKYIDISLNHAKKLGYESC